MARIGKLYLGGYQPHGENNIRSITSAVAFDLTNPAPNTSIYRSEHGMWEVEMRMGQRSIVARSSENLQRDKIMRIGLEQIQRALDIFAYKDNWCNIVANPGNSHVILYRRAGELVLQCFEILNLDIGAYARFDIRDENGNIKKKPPASSRWERPLRYYRLSQSASDIYEAYRNLFLGLEALLYSICPNTKGGEKEWLRRAVKLVSKTIDLGQFVPHGTNDPIEWIIKNLYTQIRCKLFHAKGKLPATYEGSANPEKVSAGYVTLIRLWRRIAQRYLRIGKELGDGVIINIGWFRSRMDKAFSNGLSMLYTDDNSPAGKEDKEVSPLGRIGYHFDKVRYLSETFPGHFSWIGTKRFSHTSMPSLVHRIGYVVDNILLGVNFFEDGVYPDGVDIFENRLIIRLRDKNLPKIFF